MSNAADPATVSRRTVNIRWFADIGFDDLLQVGGKNSSLGELIGHLGRRSAGARRLRHTADAYRRFLGPSGLLDRINHRLNDLDVDNISELSRVGELIRTRLLIQAFRLTWSARSTTPYRQIFGDAGGVAVAVRSSATAEDMRKPPSPVNRRPSSTYAVSTPS